MRLTGMCATVLMVIAALGCRQSPMDGGTGKLPEDNSITFYRLRAPGDGYDIEQASGLHIGRLGDREGLWLACDRNGGRSAGRLYFISSKTLGAAKHKEAVVADEEFRIVAPAGGWPAFADRHAHLHRDVLADLRSRIEASPDGSGPFLDLEAVTIMPSPAPPHEPRLFVAAEEPFSTVLELALEADDKDALLMSLYAYPEQSSERGADCNDGLEGLAPAGKAGELFWAEEGTKNHGGSMGPRLFFLNPRIGRATLSNRGFTVDRDVSDAMTTAVRAQRQGDMQTLNALATTPGGKLLAVDRNGGWILKIDPKTNVASRWLNLYDINGVNLRKALDDFPGQRHMPYISIEGIAVDTTGAIWLADDPAMPEGFRASCLVRLTGPKAD